MKLWKCIRCRRNPARIWSVKMQTIWWHPRPGKIQFQEMSHSWWTGRWSASNCGFTPKNQSWIPELFLKAEFSFLTVLRVCRQTAMCPVLFVGSAAIVPRWCPILQESSRLKILMRGVLSAYWIHWLAGFLDDGRGARPVMDQKPKNVSLNRCNFRCRSGPINY